MLSLPGVTEEDEHNCFFFTVTCFVDRIYFIFNVKFSVCVGMIP
jgi:hypothetical protein